MVSDELVGGSSKGASVTVDRSVCVGSGVCAVVADGLFELDADGLSSPLRASVSVQADIDAALDAVHSCPSAAITVRDED
jgi:ferredoxin